MKPTPSGPDPSTPPADLVTERARELTAEEQAAGVDDFDRPGTAEEHRRSEDTVDPPQ